MHSPVPCLSVPERDCRLGSPSSCGRCPHRKTVEQNAAMLMRSWANAVEDGRVTAPVACGWIVRYWKGAKAA